MLQVTFYSIEGPASNMTPVTKGSILLDDDKKFKTYPATSNDSTLLKNILSKSIRPRNGTDERLIYDPKEDPVGWIKNLTWYYKSHALYASEAKEITTKATQESRRRLLRLVEAQVRVRSFPRRSKKGKVGTVHSFIRNVKTIRGVVVSGATTREQIVIGKILARHDPKVLKNVPTIQVLSSRNFATAFTAGGEGRGGSSAAGFYNESTGAITINRSTMTAYGWRATLDHELGHAAYYHSPSLVLWEMENKTSTFDKFTRYAHTNDAEAFAESYMAYMAAGGKAASSKHKETFAVVKRVISDVSSKTYLDGGEEKIHASRKGKVGGSAKGRSVASDNWLRYHTVEDALKAGHRREDYRGATLQDTYNKKAIGIWVRNQPFVRK